MKRSIFATAFSLIAVIAVGCGEKDLNKDMKPVDKNAPKPSMAGDSPSAPAPGKKDPGPAVKAPVSPP